MFCSYEFHFLWVAYLIGGILKRGIPESEQICIVGLPILPFFFFFFFFKIAFIHSFFPLRLWHRGGPILPFLIRPIPTETRPQWCSGNTLTSHLWGLWFKPETLCRKVGSCLPMVCIYDTETSPNCMDQFHLHIELPIAIWPIQCWKWP